MIFFGFYVIYCILKSINKFIKLIVYCFMFFKIIYLYYFIECVKECMNRQIDFYSLVYYMNLEVFGNIIVNVILVLFDFSLLVGLVFLEEF